MKLHVLGSSSSGNCYLLQGQNETLIIELGLRFVEIKNALGYDLSTVVGAIVTHEHLDHSKSVADAMSMGIDVYSTTGTFNALKVESESTHRKHVIEPLKEFWVGNFRILPFDVQHDAAEPVGYLIEHPEMGRMLFATDTYYIKYKFSGLRHILVETNYSRLTINQFLTDSSSPISTARTNRLLKSHFSLENVEKFLKANDLTLTQNIMLLHLSNDNSDAKGFKEQIAKISGKNVYIADKDVVVTLNKYEF